MATRVKNQRAQRQEPFAAKSPTAADQASRPGQLIDAIRSLVGSLSPSEQRVAEFLLADPAEIMYLSLREVADRTETSEATVMRCCYALGLRGFQDLKVRLSDDALDAMQDGTVTVRDDDAAPAVMLKILSSAAAAISAARQNVDPWAFEHAAAALATAEKVLFVGSTPSGLLAQYAAFRYMELGGLAVAPVDSPIQHLAALHLTPNDACLAVSHTGSTREVITAVSTAAQAGAKTILISSFFRSPVAELVDIALITGNYETSFHDRAMAARAIQVPLIDALIVAAGLANKARFASAQHRSAAAAASYRL